MKVAAAGLALWLLAAPALAGNGRGFDGADDNISAGDHVEMEPAQLSLGLWVLTASTEAAAGFVDKFTGSAAGYALFTPSTDGKVALTLWTGSNQGVTATTATNDSAWHHIVATYDGSSTCDLYIDGAVDATSGCTGTIVYDTHEFFVGGDGGSTNFIAALIADVRVYGRVISAAEVAWIQSGNPHVLDGLGLWLTLLETGVGVTFADLAAGNDGACTNCPGDSLTSGGAWLRRGFGN